MSDSILNHSNFSNLNDIVDTIQFPATYTRVADVSIASGISYVSVPSSGIYLLVGTNYGSRIPPRLWKQEPSDPNAEVTITWDVEFKFDDKTNHGILFFTIRYDDTYVYMKTASNGEFTISDKRFYASLVDGSNEAIYLCKVNQISM